jgi:hypothetical protein
VFCQTYKEITVASILNRRTSIKSLQTFLIGVCRPYQHDGENFKKTCERVSMHRNNWFKEAATKPILRNASVNQQFHHVMTIFTANLDEIDYWM